jgi:hypothetical protein
MSPPAATNRLAAETSPYLRQHMHNPVDWYAWGDEAFAAARSRDCPVLLSVGYSACHWCHVMERESFEDPGIAALMNAHFVCVKVDREERPDVDQTYMAAVQLMTGQGGWPMTVFLTPEGRPFFGGTYYPPEDRYGRPGFPRVLVAVAEAWRDRRDALENHGAALLEAIREEMSSAAPPEPLTPALFDAAYQALRPLLDERLGGMRGAPKFPQPMLLDFLARYAARTGRQEPMDLAAVSLRRMAEGGIRDHLAGGFHRYSTDERWLVPHFEKMLYDNAQLASTYLRAFRAGGDAAFREVAEQTLDFVQREMTAPYGGFYSSIDADSEGEEGRCYVWSAEEVRQTLGAEDADLFGRVYGVTPRGNFEGRTVLSVATPIEAVARERGMTAGELQARLAAMRSRLLAVRNRRPRPALDDKVVVAWNGLMLAAFAEAAAVLGRADYLHTAVGNAEFVLGELRRPDGDNWMLMRTGRAAAHSGADAGPDSAHVRVAPIPGFLDDYAAYALGLLALYEATFDERWLSAAAELVDAMIARFSGPDETLYLSADAERLPVRIRDAMDNAVPCGQSLAVEAMLRLAPISDREDYRSRASNLLRRMAAPMARRPAAHGRWLCAADLYVGPVVVAAIVGDPADGRTRALLDAAYGAGKPNLLLAGRLPDRATAVPVLEGKEMLSGAPAAYVCLDRVCLEPTADPARLAELLAAH